MNEVQGIVLIATLAVTSAGVQAATATSECTASLHSGQRAEMPAAAVTTIEERVDEYLEFHARAAEANGRRPLSAWPEAPSRTN
jgi:hypothetical protein